MIFDSIDERLAAAEASGEARMPVIVSADNDMLTDDSGHACIDLFSGNGAAMLGHAHPGIAAGIKEQLDKVWIVGGLETPMVLQARAAIESFFPPTHQVAGLCSTGMEAAEFAMRIARVRTGRTGVVGFEHAGHGKSLATAGLGGDSPSGPHLPFIHRFPFVSTKSEEEILDQLEETLEVNWGDIAAVFVEPVQGSRAAHAASPAFYDEVISKCQRYGALCVFDEISTGFFRTGPAFCFSGLRQMPDVVLVGKAMANGFPASAVVADRRLQIVPAMLPGSTYANNPLAAAAIVATLSAMRAMDLPARVAAIEAVIRESLAGLDRQGVTLRGRGALWVLELPDEGRAREVAAALYKRGVFMSHTGRALRLLPAATIEMGNLKRACAMVRAVVPERAGA